MRTFIVVASWQYFWSVVRYPCLFGVEAVEVGSLQVCLCSEAPQPKPKSDISVKSRKIWADRRKDNRIHGRRHCYASRAEIYAWFQ